MSSGEEFWGEKASQALGKTKVEKVYAPVNTKGAGILPEDQCVKVDTYHKHNGRTDRIVVTFTPCVYNLLKMEDRIRVFEFGDELVGKKSMYDAYYPTKELLYIPIMLPAIEHQIAHMVEIKPERCVIPDWGLVNFGIAKYSNPSDKHFLTALVREVRVRAIQKHLGNANQKNDTLRIPGFFEDKVRSRLPDPSKRTVADWEQRIKEGRTFQEWKHFKKYGSPEDVVNAIGRFTSMEEFERYTKDLFERTYQAWSLDRIEHEWKIRLDYIRNWMETT